MTQQHRVAFSVWSAGRVHHFTFRPQGRKWAEDRLVPDLVHLVTWIDSLPEGHRGVIVANEVLDCLPVERFMRRGDALMQVRKMQELILEKRLFAMPIIRHLQIHL